MQVVLGIAADNTRDWKVRAALIGSQIAVAAYSAARRGADTRCWSSLPKSVYVARVPRPADGVLDIRADGAPAVQVNLKPGNSMVFVRKPSRAAAPSVKVVTWP